MFRYGNLMGHYRDNFVMITKYKISLSDLEKMMPWEKMIYIDMINIEEAGKQK